jgi:hypothetical protein
MITEIGSGEDAIMFAITVDDRFAAIDFLTDWLVGDVSGWPEYTEMLSAAKKGKTE